MLYISAVLWWMYYITCRSHHQSNTIKVHEMWNHFAQTTHTHSQSNIFNLNLFTDLSRVRGRSRRSPDSRTLWSEESKNVCIHYCCRINLQLNVWNLKYILKWAAPTNGMWSWTYNQICCRLVQSACIYDIIRYTYRFTFDKILRKQYFNEKMFKIFFGEKHFCMKKS